MFVRQIFATQYTKLITPLKKVVIAIIQTQTVTLNDWQDTNSRDKQTWRESFFPSWHLKQMSVVDWRLEPNNSEEKRINVTPPPSCQLMGCGAPYHYIQIATDPGRFKLFSSSVIIIGKVTNWGEYVVEYVIRLFESSFAVLLPCATNPTAIIKAINWQLINERIIAALKINVSFLRQSLLSDASAFLILFFCGWLLGNGTALDDEFWCSCWIEIWLPSLNGTKQIDKIIKKWQILSKAYNLF